MANRASGFRTGIALLLAFQLPLQSLAATYPLEDTVKKEEQALPSAPSKPPALYRAPPEERRHCGRIILYKGEHIDCDSELYQDGERLRPLIADLPEAVAALDTYQRNRRSLRPFAYAGTAGLLLALSSSIFPKLIPGAEESGTVRTLIAATGIGITAGSVLYGMHFLSENEKHLQRAIELHNQAKPDSPIELMIQASFTF